MEDEDAPPDDEVAEEQEDAQEHEEVNPQLVRGTGGMVYTMCRATSSTMAACDNPQRTAQSIRPRSPFDSRRMPGHSHSRECMQ